MFSFRFDFPDNRRFSPFHIIACILYKSMEYHRRMQHWHIQYRLWSRKRAQRREGRGGGGGITAWHHMMCIVKHRSFDMFITWCVKYKNSDDTCKAWHCEQHNICENGINLTSSSWVSLRLLLGVIGSLISCPAVPGINIIVKLNYLREQPASWNEIQLIQHRSQVFLSSSFQFFLLTLKVGHRFCQELT